MIAVRTAKEFSRILKGGALRRAARRASRARRGPQASRAARRSPSAGRGAARRVSRVAWRARVPRVARHALCAPRAP